MTRAFVLIFCAALIPFAYGQAWDSTGNNLLQGTYNFREVRWVTPDGTNLTSAESRFGTITFNGAGNYSISGSTNTGSAYTVTNASYSMSAGGLGFLNPPTGGSAQDRIIGLVSNGIFIGSSTEGSVNNLFIAARQSATPVTSATFQRGNYAIDYVNPSGLNLDQIRTSTFSIQPNDRGTLGGNLYDEINIRCMYNPYDLESHYDDGCIGDYVPASFSFSDGVGTFTFGGSGHWISGDKQFYVAEGGQFIFGGSTTGVDMLVGIHETRLPLDAPVTGLYFQAGLYRDFSDLSKPSLNSFLGALSANWSSQPGQILWHQRIKTSPGVAHESTYGGPPTDSTGAAFNFFLRFQNVTIEARGGGIAIYLRAPELSGSGVFLNPNGVVNAASYSAFTARISPGELLTLFGTGLAPGNFEDSSFPTTLGGVSVTINGRLAPIYIASPNGLAVLVPYEIEGSEIAEITVNNNGIISNRVTTFVGKTSPGAFATPIANGLGYVAARHTTRADQGIVSVNDPAVPGEYLAVFLTGLGTVNPAITTGQSGPQNPLSFTTVPIKVKVDGQETESNFAGIAPLLHGLYQINVKVPDNAKPGDLVLEIAGVDSQNTQILIPVAKRPTP